PAPVNGIVKIFLAAAVAVPTPALACDCRTLFPGSPNFARHVDEVAAYYSVAADGVVERDGPYGWRLRVTRELKGTGAATYSIVLSSDCSVDPQTMNALVGKPVFLLLAPVSTQGSKDAYEAGRCVNFQ